MRKQTEGPAFPTSGNHDQHGQVLNLPQNGMSLRGYFAAKALQGLISREDYRMFPNDGNDLNDEHVATTAYTIADAMLAAREAK